MQDGNKAIAAGAQKEQTLLERWVRLKPLKEFVGHPKQQGRREVVVM